MNRKSLFYLKLFSFYFFLFFFSLFSFYLFFRNKTFPKRVEKDNGPFHFDKQGFSSSDEAISDVKNQQENLFSVLLMGMGGAGHAGGNLTDSNILLVIKIDKKKAYLITLPRDLWVPIPESKGLSFNKLNKAYALGGGELSKKTVSEITGVKVKKYIAVDFNGFQRIIGLLGGIKVSVPKTYEDFYYPIKGKELDLCGKSPAEIEMIHKKFSGFELEKQFACRFEHIRFEKGENVMSGEEALKYSRSRHGDSDFGRLERQVAVLKGIKDKIISMDFFRNSPQILDAILANVKTDITIEEIKDFLQIVADPASYSVEVLSLNTENFLSSSDKSGGYILFPKEGVSNWGGIKKAILEFLEN